MSKTLSRRRFLQGLGATSIALPMLPSLTLAADGDVAMRRLVIFYTPCGFVPGSWRPQDVDESVSEATQWQFGSVLQPLQPYQDRVIQIQGLDLHVGKQGHKGISNILTGEALVTDTSVSEDGDNHRNEYGGGQSIDQYIADHIADSLQPTPFRSLEFGAHCRGPSAYNRMIHRAAFERVEPEMNPRNVFNRLFADGGNAEPLALERIQRRRESILSYALEDIRRVREQVAADERDRLDAHLGSIRDLEERLAQAADAPACGPDGVAEPASGDWWEKNANFPDVLKTQIDLMVRSLACGMTRVASLQCGDSLDGVVYNFVDAAITEKHHTMTHESWKNRDPVHDRNRGFIRKINEWYGQQFRYLVDQLDAAPSGAADGSTLLDHTMVVWVSEMPRGIPHVSRDIPVVIVSGKNGPLKTGRYLQFGDRYTGGNEATDYNRPITQLHVSMADYMGVPINHYGQPFEGNDEVGRLTEIHV